MWHVGNPYIHAYGKNTPLDLNFCPDEVSALLMDRWRSWLEHEHDPKPEHFNGTTFGIKEKDNNSFWKLTIKIDPVNKTTFLQDIEKEKPDYTYILLYNHDPTKSRRCGHAYAVEEDGDGNTIVECITHDPKVGFLKIKIERYITRVPNHF